MEVAAAWDCLEFGVKSITPNQDFDDFSQTKDLFVNSRVIFMQKVFQFWFEHFTLRLGYKIICLYLEDQIKTTIDPRKQILFLRRAGQFSQPNKLLSWHLSSIKALNNVFNIMLHLIKNLYCLAHATNYFIIIKNARRKFNFRISSDVKGKETFA